MSKNLFGWMVMLAFVAILVSQLQTPAAPAESDAGLTAAELQAYGGSKIPQLPPMEVQRPRTITMIGDSLSLVTARHIVSDSDTLWHVDALGGRPLTVAKPLITSSVPTTDVFVIALGTNDCAGNVNDKQLKERIYTTLSVTEGKPTSFLTLGENGPIKACAERFNRLLRELAGSIPALTVLDWQAVIQNHPEWYGGQGDGIHLIPDAYAARASWLQQQF